MNEPHRDASVLASIIEANHRQSQPGSRVLRADIKAIADSGLIEVVPVDESCKPFQCDLLESAFSRDVRLEVGDIVLALSPGSPEENGCILGRIAAYNPRPQAPDKVVIEAAEELTLKCGDASLDLRKDGKLMIRGKDVLTRAKRTQRIKGGTVAIN